MCNGPIRWYRPTRVSAHNRTFCVLATLAVMTLIGCNTPTSRLDQALTGLPPNASYDDVRKRAATVTELLPSEARYLGSIVMDQSKPNNTRAVAAAVLLDHRQPGYNNNSLHDSNPIIRAIAAEGYVAGSEDEAFDIEIDLLEKDTDQRVRWIAANKLPPASGQARCRRIVTDWASESSPEIAATLGYHQFRQASADAPITASYEFQTEVVNYLNGLVMDKEGLEAFLQKIDTVLGSNRCDLPTIKVGLERLADRVDPSSRQAVAKSLAAVRGKG